MTQHFVENTEVEQQLFVFRQNFESSTCDCFDNVLKYFENHFEEQQQSNWVKYWEEHGEQIVLQQWKFKYKNFLAPSEDEIVSDSKVIENVKTPSTNLDNVDNLNCQDNADEWLELWQQHNEEIYFEQYILYTSVFYNYFLCLKNSAQIRIEYSERKSDSEEDPIQSEDIAAEFEQLQLLGLPTSFGGRPQTNRKKYSKSKECFEHFCTFFSDEDEDTCLEDLTFLKMNENITDSVANANSDVALHAIQDIAIAKEKKKRKNRKLRNVPDFLLAEKGLLKYWRKRFSLFSRFDEGIRLDRESWFSVTPEKVADHLAKRLACDLLIDAFCGSGGNAIQFARTCRKVIAIDIDPLKVEMARHNAGIYGVANKIEFIVGDFLQLAANAKLQADIVFLSPPWGGPKYKNKNNYDIEKFLLPVGATDLVTETRKISANVALFLPRNSNMQQILKLAGIGNRCEVEHNYLDIRLVAITALYGDDIINK